MERNIPNILITSSNFFPRLERLSPLLRVVAHFFALGILMLTATTFRVCLGRTGRFYNQPFDFFLGAISNHSTYIIPLMSKVGRSQSSLKGFSLSFALGILMLTQPFGIYLEGVFKTSHLGIIEAGHILPTSPSCFQRLERFIPLLSTPPRLWKETRASSTATQHNTTQQTKESSQPQKKHKEAAQQKPELPPPSRKFVMMMMMIMMTRMMMMMM